MFGLRSVYRTTKDLFKTSFQTESKVAKYPDLDTRTQREKRKDAKADAKHQLKQKVKAQVYVDKPTEVLNPFVSDPNRGKLLFDTPTFHGKPIPTVLQSLRVDDAPKFAGSIAKYVPNLDDPAEQNLYKDLKRAVKPLLTRDGLHTDDNVDLMRDVLLQLYSTVPDFKPKSEKDYPLPHGLSVNDHVAIPNITFDERFFVDSYTNKGKLATSHVLTLNVGPNELFKLAEAHFKPGRSMCIRVIKSIIRTCLATGKSEDQIVDVVTKKCFLWRSGECDWSKFSWIFEYVSPQVYHYGIDSPQAFYKALRDKAQAVQSNLVAFVRHYIERGKLSRKERDDLYHNRSVAFANIMRSKEIQAMFYAGASREYVVEYVQANYHTQLDKSMDKDQIVVGKRHERAVKSSKARAVARDRKFQVQHEHLDFETQSSLATMPTASSFSAWFLVLCFVVYHVCERTRLVDWFCLNIHRLLMTILSPVLWFKRTLYRVVRIADDGMCVVERQINLHSDFVDEIESWSRFLKHPTTLLSDSNYSPIILEVKSVVHAIYHVSRGENTLVLAWLSNLLFTRPQTTIDTIMGFFTRILPAVFTKQGQRDERAPPVSPTCLVEHRGVTYHLTHEQHQQYIAITTMGGNVDEFLAGIFQTQSFATVISTISEYFTSSGITHVSPADIRDANARWTYLNNQKKTFEGQIDTFKNILSVIGRVCFSFDPFDLVHQSFVARMLDIIDYTNNIKLRNDLLSNNAMMKDCLAKMRQANVLMADPMMSSVPSVVVNSFRDVTKQLDLLAMSCSAKLGSGGVRPEPLAILFTGPPCGGKTALVNLMQAVISQHDGSIHTADQTYSYNSQSDFWEGYASQKFVVIDDAFKEADINIRLKQAGDIIGLVNTTPFPLNMAFGQKGNMYFNSEFIFVTTNIANNGYQLCTFDVGVTDPAAVVRRFQLILHKPDRLGDDLFDSRFRVDKCDLLPALVGQFLSPEQVCALAIRVRDLQRVAHERHTVSGTKIAEIVANINNGQLLNFQTQSDDMSPLNPVRMITYLVSLIKDSPFFQNKRNVSCFIGGFFLLIALSTLGPLYKVFFSSEFQETSRDLKTPKQQIKRLRRAQRDAKFESQSRLESTNRSLVNNVSRTVVKMFMKGTSRGVDVCESCNGIHVRDGFICTPAHFFMAFSDCTNVSMCIRWADQEHHFDLPVKAMCVEGEDIVVFKLPLRCDLPPAAYKYFDTFDDSYLVPPGTELSFFCVDDNANCELRTMLKTPYEVPVTYPGANLSFTIETPIAYHGNSVRGESGSLVCSSRFDGSVCAIGMHVGKVERPGVTTGFAVPLDKNFLDSIIKAVDPNSPPPFPHEVLAVVPTSLGHHFPTESKIKRSPWFEYIKDTPYKIPAVLATVDGVSPIYNAMRKQHQIPTKPTAIPDSVYDYLFYHYPRKAGARVLDYDEALNGHDCVGALAVNSGTSPGYPYSLLKGKGKGKAPYIIRVRDDKLAYNPQFFSELKQYHESLLAGEQIEVLWAVFLKDELRLPEKVKLRKTRMVSACPLHFLILIRQYFLDFVLFVQARAAHHPVSVGLNTASLDWHIMYERLATKGQSIIAGDYENFDGKLPAFVGQVVLNFINQWYNDDPVSQNVRRLLFEHITHATHICYENIYQVCDGNPSGNPITSIYNSLCNMVMVYTVLTEDLACPMTDFDMVVYGDDNVIAVKRTGLRCSSIAHHLLRRFDIVYTHFSKDSVDRDDTLETIRYLGRSFSKVGPYLRCPLELDVVLNIPRWVSGDIEPSLVLMSIADSFFRELSHFPRDLFEEKCAVFIEYVTTNTPQYAKLVNDMKLPYTAYITEMYIKDVKHTQFIVTSAANAYPPRGIKSIEKYFADSKKTAGTPARVETTDNAEFNDRATNEVAPTQTEQLGNFNDATTVEHTVVNDTTYGPAHRTTNIELFKFDDALERQYVLGTASWLTSQAMGTTLLSFSFPHALFQIPFIKSKVQDFTMFRAGFRVGLRIQASRFLYGRVMMVYTPQAATNAYNAQANNLYMASGYPHVLASASSGDTVFLDVPFISPRRFLDVAGAAADAMGTVTVLVMTPLININGAVDSSSIILTAQFIDAELAFPCPTVIPTSNRSSSMPTMPTLRAPVPVIYDPPPPDAFEPGSNAGDAYKQSLCYKKLLEYLRNVHAGRDGDFYPTSKKGGTSMHEAFSKAKSGVMSSDLAQRVGTSGEIAAPPYMKPYVNMFKRVTSAVKTGLSVAAMIGFDKPTNLALPTPVTMKPLNNFGNGRGIENAGKASVDPEAAVANVGMFCGIDTDEMDLAYVVGTPQMTAQFALVAATPTTVVCSTNPYALISPYTYVDFVSRLFKFVSGSLKVKGYITASLMHSVRLAFYLARAPGDWQSSYHSVVDVQGDTEFEFTLPYSCLNVLNDLDINDYWNLYVTVLSFSQPTPGVSAPIYLSVYKAAASDFACQYPRDVQFFMTTSNPRADFNKVFPPIHHSVTSYEPDNILYTERVRSIADLAKRMTPKNLIVDENWHAVYQCPGTAAVPYNDLGYSPRVVGLELLGLLYCYWRGGITVQLLKPTTTTTALLMVGRNAPAGTQEYTAGFDMSSVVSPNPTITVPYYEDNMYVSTSVPIAFKSLFCTTTTNPCIVCTAAADDFRFGFLRPVPAGLLQSAEVGYVSCKAAF